MAARGTVRPLDLAGVDEVDGHERVPGRQILERRDQALARGLRGHGQPEVERHGERAAAEHHARPEPLEELLELDGGPVLLEPDVPALERRPGLVPQSAGDVGDGRSMAYSSSPQT